MRTTRHPSRRARARTRAVALVVTTATTLALLPLTAAAPAAARAPAPAAAPAAAAAGNPVVLGAKEFVSYGSGWGTAHPSRIHNGGAPSGGADHIRWRGWGKRVAIGRGLTPIYHSGGGYYRTSGRIVLKATRIGRCEQGGPRAYRHLSARIVDRPGGKLGRWFEWGGQDDLCSWD